MTEVVLMHHTDHAQTVLRPRHSRNGTSRAWTMEALRAKLEPGVDGSSEHGAGALIQEKHDVSNTSENILVSCVLKSHGQDYLVGNKLSRADIHLVELLYYVEELDPRLLANFPLLKSTKAERTLKVKGETVLDHVVFWFCRADRQVKTCRSPFSLWHLAGIAPWIHHTRVKRAYHADPENTEWTAQRDPADPRETKTILKKKEKKISDKPLQDEAT
ncbi:hypothetical protein E5288_WYG013841 [Bos mutus]|uniref:GST C-terminal domain-containing protein n=1 Tax=Bos mutus TaxID=72004 RepID=A0A6B0S8E9_9CETA|nr:hypothetical protein [Bos mutus]